MAAEWAVASLADVAVFENRRRIPLSAAERSERPGPYPYWGANGPFDTIDDYLFDGPRVLVAEDGNTVVRRDGRGTVHWADGRYWVNNHAHVLSVQDGNDLRWLYFALLSAEVRELVSGSAQPKLSMSSLKRLRLAVPPPPEQRAVADVLGALDDKIESNGRVAVGLAATFAAAWGRSAARSTSAVELGDLAKCIRVSGEPRADYIGLDDMPQGSTILRDWKAPGDAPKGASWAFEVGDILFGKLRPYFKKVGVAPIAGRCTREIVVVRPRDPSDYGVVLGALTSDAFIDHCIAVSSGTRMPRSEWRDAARFEVAAVNGHMRHELADEARRCYALVAGLTLESRRLIAIRDALLPRLVSGRLRVPLTPEPEEVIQAVLDAV